MRYKLIPIILGILMLTIVQASIDDYGTVKQNDCILIKQICSSCSYINVSIAIKDQILVNNSAMIQQGITWTYQFCETSEIGRYDVNGIGDINGIETGFDSAIFKVDSQGYSEEKGLTEVTIFITVLIVLLMFVYLKVDKFIGSMGLFASGFAILFKVSEHGWIGWIIIMTSFSMLIGSLIGGKKKRRKYR